MANLAAESSGSGPPLESGAWLTSFLPVLQLSDSLFPSGRYTLSHGLEAFAQSGRLPTPSRPSTLVALLGDCIRFGVGPSDGVALACAHRAADHDGAPDLELVTRADQRLTAVKLAEEARAASVRSGRALMTTATAAFEGWATEEYVKRVNDGRAPGNHAVVFGLLCSWLRVPRLVAVAAELYAFAASWVAAAVRLELVDHRTAQGVLYRVFPVIAETASMTFDKEVSQIWSCTPLVDVMTMRHEQAELRLFAS